MYKILLHIISPPLKLFKGRLVQHSLIAALAHGLVQLIRFGSNIILASLLTPAIFGLLALVTTVRTGVELLTDVGITQSIIVAKDGDDQRFIETAWGIQLIRGFVLFLIGAITAFPIAWLYGVEELGILLLIGSIGSIISGIGRPGPAILQKNRKVGKLAVFRLSIAVLSAAIVIAFALKLPSALGIVLGGLVALGVSACLSFLILPLPSYVPRLEREYRSRILNFGKWIFLSSVIYFFAQNFDRLYLPANIPLAIFGIYGISRSLSDVVVQTVVQINQLVVFPAVAQSAGGLAEMREKLAKTRLLGLAICSFGVGVLIAGSDLLILMIFDSRYELGATILPILLFGSWFAIHASVNEAVLLGLGRTKAIAGGNAIRLGAASIGIPAAFSLSGLPAGLAAITLLDLPRYVWLVWSASKVRMAFFRQDLVIFALMIFSAIAIREAMVLMGFVDAFVSNIQLEGFWVLMNNRLTEG